MTGLVRKAILITVGASLYAGAAMAVTPSQANSNFPASGIALIGYNTLNTPQADTQGEFSVTVRDGSNLVIQGATVTVNFNNCTPDINLSRTQTFTGVSVLCNGPRGVISAQTNNLGVATFRILGGDQNLGPGTGVGYGCAELRANSVFFNNLTVATYDQVGNLNGVTGGDLAAWTADFFAVVARGRSDYNFSSTITGGDLSIWVGDFFSGRSANNGGALPLCP